MSLMRQSSAEVFKSVYAEDVLGGIVTVWHTARNMIKSAMCVK